MIVLNFVIFLSQFNKFSNLQINKKLWSFLKMKLLKNKSIAHNKNFLSKFNETITKYEQEI